MAARQSPLDMSRRIVGPRSTLSLRMPACRRGIPGFASPLCLTPAEADPVVAASAEAIQKTAAALAR